MNTTATPRIYVACLASYNNGVLHGAWIDANDIDAIKEGIVKVLATSKFANVEFDCYDCAARVKDCAPDSIPPSFPNCQTCKGLGKIPSAEEWAIHDYEGFAGIKLGENPDLEKVAKLGQLIEEQSDENLLRAAVEVSDYHADADAILETIEDKYQGCYDSLAEWAESMCEDCDDGSLTKLPNFIRYHIDWEAIAELELIMSGDYSSVNIDGSFYIFNNNA